MAEALERYKEYLVVSFRASRDEDLSEDDILERLRALGYVR